jgi:hypothetical protein
MVFLLGPRPPSDGSGPMTPKDWVDTVKTVVEILGILVATRLHLRCCAGVDATS